MTPFEAVVAAEMIRQGYEVLTKGWPDQLAINWETKKVRLIEVKGIGDDIRASQRKMHDALRLMGFDVEIIRENPDKRMTWVEDGESQYRPRGFGGRPNIQMQAAMNFLRVNLQNNPPINGKQLIQTARDTENISRSTLYHAANNLGIKMTHIAAGITTWELPRKEVENGVN